MTTYYLLAGMLAPLTQSDGLLQDFSAEIRSGGYAKYLVKPLSPLGYFLTAGFARALLPLLASIAVLTIVRLEFAGALRSFSRSISSRHCRSSCSGRCLAC